MMPVGLQHFLKSGCGCKGNECIFNMLFEKSGIISAAGHPLNADDCIDKIDPPVKVDVAPEHGESRGQKRQRERNVQYVF